MRPSSLNLRWLASHAAALARFSVVGLICFVASLAFYATLCEVAHVPYMHSYFLTFIMANVLGFWLNGRFTFSTGRRFDRASLVRYVLVNVVLFGLSALALRLLVESLNVWYLGATVIVAIANLPLSFVTHRLVSYRIGSTRPALPDSGSS